MQLEKKTSKTSQRQTLLQLIFSHRPPINTSTKSLTHYLFPC